MHSKQNCFFFSLFFYIILSWSLIGMSTRNMNWTVTMKKISWGFFTLPISSLHKDSDMNKRKVKKKIVSMNLSKSECIWYINDIGHHMHSLLYSSMSTQLIIGVEAGCKPAGLVGCSLKNIKTKRKKKKRLSVFKSYM